MVQDQMLLPITSNVHVSEHYTMQLHNIIIISASACSFFVVSPDPFADIHGQLEQKCNDGKSVAKLIFHACIYWYVRHNNI